MSCTSIVAVALGRTLAPKVRSDRALQSALLNSSPDEAERVLDLIAFAAHFAETEHAASMSADGGDVSQDPSVRRDHDALLSACRRLRNGA
jgi:hypothetical protein